MSRLPANVDLKFSGRGMAAYRLVEGAMFNRRSKMGDRKSVDPPAAVGNKDRQFFHHELGLADGADHVCPGRDVPFL
jgi:hypothetical protein